MFRTVLFFGILLSLAFTSPIASGRALSEKPNTYELYSAFINFQDKNTTPPSGFIKDYGKPFGNGSFVSIGKTFNYGWKNSVTLMPIDLSDDASNNGNGVGRNRLGTAYNSSNSAEKLEGTFIHLQGYHNSEWQNQPRGTEAFWEIEVPNGIIEVTMSFGDKGEFTDSRHTATVEDYTIVAAFEPQTGETRTVTMFVDVQDGALTVTGLGGYNSKINFIELHEIVHNEETASGILNFNSESKKTVLIAGENQGNIENELQGTGASTIGLVIENDMTKINDQLLDANDWLTLPNNPSIGQLNFNIDAEGMQTGETRESSIIATAAGFKPTTFSASLSIEAGCSPLSLLACDQLVQNMPFTIAFNGSGNGLLDMNGKPTGFTTALPHSKTRHNDDDPASYPSVNGYEASKIKIDGGNLNLTATKGISDLDKNNQVNTLGIAMQNLQPTFQIETKLLDLDMPSNGDAQAGLSFGFNENYFVKLIVLNGNTIQLKKEINSKSASGLNNDDNITVGNLSLIGKDVALRLIFDRNSNTIAASYAIDQGDFLPLTASGVSEIELPDALLTGRTNPNEIAGSSLAGIFASYNNAANPFEATFNYFKIGDVEATLGIAQKTNTFEGIKVYPNPVHDQLNINISQDQNSKISSIILYDLQGRMINEYNAALLKNNSGYQVQTSGFSAGFYLLQFKTDQGDTKQIKFIKSN
ncbi:MAG: T9SS type A sorting domain-containing protein [Leeuwenhoekiella sp.]